eukprot:GHVS01015073.1.p1 GENE.GHVS01015073.1~~GHVS01015073.1.p1  ORF type:complete len:420 (+),score=70.92 GHVS01015073.1:191-1450(+)
MISFTQAGVLLVLLLSTPAIISCSPFHLRKLLSTSAGSPIRLSPSLYRELVVDVPKGFHLLVLFTTDDEKVCGACRRVNEDFVEIAKNYAMEGRHEVAADEGQKKKDPGVFGVDGAAGDLVVFAIYDVLQDRQIVHLHQITTIPMVVSITNKSMKALRSPPGKNVLSFRNEDVYQIQGPTNVGGGGEVVRLLTGRSGGGLEWINMKTSRNVEILPSAYHHVFFLFKLTLLLSFVGVFFWLLLRLLAAYPFLLPLGAMGVHMVSTSGIFFSVQNSVPFIGKSGSWIANNNRSQYLGEGLLMSFTLVAAAVTLVLLVNLPSFKWLNVDTTTAKKTELTKKKSGKELMEPAVPFTWLWWRYLFFSRAVLRNILTVLLMVVFMTLLNSLLKVYSLKAPWYDPTFMPPAGYIRGDIRADRGNEF